MILTLVFLTLLKIHVTAYDNHVIPYQAVLIIFEKSGRNLCGGSLITEKVVLTAAHCTISAYKVQAVLGAYKFRKTEQHQIVITTKTWINHPNYNPKTYSNDIAVIILPVIIAQNKFIKTIALDKSGTFTGLATISGWGVHSTEINKAVATFKVEIIPNNLCKKFYKHLDERNVCSTSANMSCYGYSGSALVINNVQIGIVSHGVENCTLRYPIAHTKISEYFKWIEGHLLNS